MVHVLSLGLGSTHQLLGVVAWRIQRLRGSIIFYRALITVVDMRFVINSTIEKGLTAQEVKFPRNIIVAQLCSTVIFLHIHRIGLAYQAASGCIEDVRCLETLREPLRALRTWVSHAHVSQLR